MENDRDKRQQIPGLMLDDLRLEREVRAGFWPNRVLTDYYDVWLNTRPNDTALITHRTDQGRETRLTYAELDVHVNNIAANLTRRGVQPGDVVSYQLPNRWEFVALLLACIRVGAVSNPLMPIFRRRELEFMVGRVGAKVLIVPAVFRNFDHAAMAGKLKSALPSLEHVIIVDGQDEQSFAGQLLVASATQPDFYSSLTPNQVLKVMYTSGTTGEPKGVIHTSNTLLSTIIALADRIGVTGKDVMFVPTPFAHSFGFVYGIMLSIYLGIPLVTLDVWEPATAIALMEHHGVTFSFGTPPFLSDLAHFPNVRQRRLDALRLFLASGAPIPRALAREAERNLGLKVEVAFGMTELGIVSATNPARPDLGRDSDGYDLVSCETRIVDAERRELPPGAAGSLECRGSSTFVGYHRRPDLYAVDAEGWFDTGDLAKKDADGCLQIVGRKKDIIIRGGENIPVVEVEKLIHEMPQVREAALVAIPDPRLGERVCAYVALHEGALLTLAEIVDFLEGQGLARQYLPERLVLVTELPKTPSGKIQKYLLREQAARLTV